MYKHCRMKKKSWWEQQTVITKTTCIASHSAWLIVNKHLSIFLFLGSESCTWHLFVSFIQQNLYSLVFSSVEFRYLLRNWRGAKRMTCIYNWKAAMNADSFKIEQSHTNSVIYTSLIKKQRHLIKSSYDNFLFLNSNNICT